MIHIRCGDARVSMKSELFFWVLFGRGDLHTTVDHALTSITKEQEWFCYRPVLVNNNTCNNSDTCNKV